MSNLSVRYTGKDDIIGIENGSKGPLTCSFYELWEYLGRLGLKIPPRCPVCNGAGEVSFPVEESRDISTCPSCEGTRVVVA